LLEPQRTNVIVFSEQFNNAAWTKFNTTITANDTIAPDGTTTADKVIESATTGAHLVRNPQTLASGVTYTISCFLKADTRNVVWLIFGGNTFGFPSIDFRRAIFDLSNGTIIASPTSGSAKIVNYGNGWYRCSVTITIVAGGVGNLDINLADPLDPLNNSYTGDGVSGLFAWGAQLEAGSYPTSYIPTLGSSVTRLADAASKTGISSLIGQSEGVLYAEIDVTNFTADDRILAISDGTSNNRILLQKGANATFQAIVTTASGSVADIATASGQTAGVYKIALAYAVDDFVLYVNGSQIGTDTSGSVPACADVYVGKIETSATTNQLNDRITAGALYPIRISNAELAQLTTL
jgi:hypothetical protein